jgi:hypothetical protein
MRIFTALLTVSLFTATFAYAQPDSTGESDDLMGMLQDDVPAAKEYVSAIFKATRIVNGHSVENVGKGVLDFRVCHRFGELKDASNFFGLDNAATVIGFDYGVTDWLMLGINRSTYEKEFQGLAKIKLLRQRNGKGMPISLSYFGAVSAHGMPAPALPAGQEYYFSNRMFFVNQLLIARKFSNAFSLQITPTHIHYNLVPTTPEPNSTFAIGIGGRLKVSNRVSLNAEYYYRLPGSELTSPTTPYTNCVSLGVDIETGGHVFQLMLTNAASMSERAFIGQNLGDIGKGGIHFGFNLSRVFTIVRPKGFEASRNKTW